MIYNRTNLSALVTFSKKLIPNHLPTNPPTNHIPACRPAPTRPILTGEAEPAAQTVGPESVICAQDAKIARPPAPAVPKKSQEKTTHLRKSLPPITPQKKRKPDNLDELVTLKSPKTPKLSQEEEPQRKKNCQPKKICQPKAKLFPHKVWNEFTKIDGKILLMKTIDVGQAKSTRKPKISAHHPPSQTIQNPEMPKCKKKAEIDTCFPTDQKRPRRRYLALRTKESTN